MKWDRAKVLGVRYFVWWRDRLTHRCGSGPRVSANSPRLEPFQNGLGPIKKKKEKENSISQERERDRERGRSVPDENVACWIKWIVFFFVVVFRVRVGYDGVVG